MQRAGTSQWGGDRATNPIKPGPLRWSSSVSIPASECSTPDLALQRAPCGCSVSLSQQIGHLRGTGVLAVLHSSLGRAWEDAVALKEEQLVVES